MLEFLATFSAAIMSLLVFSIFCLWGLSKLLKTGGESLKAYIETETLRFKWSLRLKIDRPRALEMLRSDLEKGIKYLDEKTTNGLAEFWIREDVFFSRIGEDEFILVDQKQQDWAKGEDDPSAFIWKDKFRDPFIDGREHNT